MNILAITQARSNSTRLPGKVLRQINGKSLLQIHIQRVLSSRSIDDYLIATTTNSEDEAIVRIAKECGVKFFQGDEKDVLDRFYRAASKYDPEWIVRLTSDCPLIDPALLDMVIEKAISGNYDYYSNCQSETFPDGQDIEVFKFGSLETAWKEAKLPSEREHVTPYLRNSEKYNIEEFKNDLTTYSDVRLTVDEESDFQVIEALVKDLGINKDWKTYADHYQKHERINAMNRDIIRNQGYLESLKNDKSNG